MSFCNNCGYQLPEGANVCPQCGMPIAQNPVFQQAPVPGQAPVRPKPKFKVSNKLLASAAKIFMFVMAGFAVLTVLYGFITAIVAGARLRSFPTFMATFCSSFITVARFVFFGIVSGYISKKLEE